MSSHADEPALAPRQVVMIISHGQFRDEELLRPKEILESHGISVKVASTSLSEASGVLGARVKPDALLNEVRARDYSAIIFVGGPGASAYWDDPVAQRVAQEAFNSNRVVAAICIAPVTLANAGILKSKRATVWPDYADKLTANGAVYTGRKVERDGNIITASGPEAAAEFAEELLRQLKY